MSFKNEKNSTEHAYKTIENDIKTNQIKGVILLYGQESYLIDWSVKTLIDRYINPACREFDMIRFNGQTAAFEEIRNSIETLPMFSEKKLILVEKLKCLEAESEDEKKWQDYLREIPDYCLLIFINETVDARRRLIKTINEVGKSYEFDQLPESFLKKFIAKQLKAGGKTAKAQIIDDFISESGYYDKNTSYTLYNLDHDLTKLLAHASGEAILQEDIRQTLSGNIERDVFAMMEAIGKGNKGSAFQMLNHLFLFGENEYKILGLISSQYENVTMIKEMKEEGKSLAEISDCLGLNAYRARLLLALSEKYTLSRLKSIMLSVYKVDRRIKTGVLDKNLALEVFIAEI